MTWHKEIIRIFRSIFPEQTKTPVRIVLWSIVLFADVILCICCAVYFGIITPDSFSTWMMIPIVVAVIALFWIQCALYGVITKRFKRS